MSRFIDVLYAYLSTYAGLTAQISTKEYPDKFPQTISAPQVLMIETNREKLYTHSGYTGTSIYSYQLSAYAKTKDAVELIAAQLANAMEAWRSTNSAVGYALQRNESSLYEANLEVYCIDTDFDIFYNE